MTSEQRQIHQTALFLRTSFEAVQCSIAGRLEDPLPCWLDTSMVMMLSRELKRCCHQSKPLFVPEASEQLYLASQQCDLLLKQCPGMLSSAMCYRHLGTILTPLNEAIQHMAIPIKMRWPWQKRAK